MRVPPAIGSDWKAWAQALSVALTRGQSQLETKRADSSAAVDGVLMWDADAGEIVVSSGGAWVSVTDGGAP